MKVLQLTFHDKKNFGAFLQSFALQKFLEQQSIESQIIDYRPTFLFYHPIFFSERMKKKLPFIWHFLAIARYFQKNQALHHFKEWKILKKTKRYFHSSRFKENANCVIVGSDQVWNPDMIKNQENFFFLEFIPDNVKKISYAASLGMQQWPKNFEKKVAPILHKFKAISVRENSAALYLNSLGFSEVITVCDPTLLHNGDFYRREFSIFDCSVKTDAFFFLIREVIPNSIMESFSKKQIKKISPSIPQSMSSVAQWLCAIESTRIVVTDSFHCTVFCLLFHKDFIVLQNHSSMKGMNERFSTLLSKVGLADRILDETKSHSNYDKILKKNINWNEVDTIIDNWRVSSKEWLTKQLSE